MYKVLPEHRALECGIPHENLFSGNIFVNCPQNGNVITLLLLFPFSIKNYKVRVSMNDQGKANIRTSFMHVNTEKRINLSRIEGKLVKGQII